MSKIYERSKMHILCALSNCSKYSLVLVPLYSHIMARIKQINRTLVEDKYYNIADKIWRPLVSRSTDHGMYFGPKKKIQRISPSSANFKYDQFDEFQIRISNTLAIDLIKIQSTDRKLDFFFDKYF